MHYLELMQRFWDFNPKQSIGTTGISMYLYLLKIGSDNDSCDFQISDVVISKELGVTRKTVKSTKEKLRNLGLIQYQTTSGLACKYTLIGDYPSHISAPEIVKKEEIGKEDLIQETEESGVSLLKNFLVQIFSENSKDQEIESDLLQTIQSSQPQPTTQKGNDENIPSLEEFMTYAKTLKIYKPELDSEIQSKYENWKKNGWKNSSDRPITNWKSSLKSTLPFIKSQTESHQLSLQSIPDIKRPKCENGNL
ncbi:hypothetical protein SAMN05421856_103306 [Chryseobacterium taichungense]|uniref:Helix-turn-helix domain-containing protein n=1 Tax=Chryseobacterium taichungense TaxID=295069 RepID=A0A1H7YFL0_9FLAO|nr:hypothetical protein [Chryseobacterium taichungense]SEM45036.1 hypothetical protein SAMN05421856_103306 [Chryseobacterium taichungense]